MERYVPPEEFAEWKQTAEDMGFTYCASGPLVRSSYKAGEFFMSAHYSKNKGGGMGLKEIVLPDLGEGVIEGEILKIKVSPGEKISMDQILLEVMTDKASMEVPSSISGKIQAVHVSEGDIVSVGASLFTVETEAGSSKNKIEANKTEKTLEDKQVPLDKKKPSEMELAIKKSQQAPSDKESNNNSKEIPLAAPVTRKLAKELGLSLNNISGQGPQGAVRREDLISHLKERLNNPTHLATGRAFSSNSKPPANIEEDRREPLRGIKRLMFESMTLSKATIPHFTIGERACVQHLVQIRKEMNSHLEKQGLKTGYLAFFIKALLPVLKEFPLFNSFYDPKTKEIVFRKGCHIGFAVDSPEGLVVPVLKSAEKKSLLEIIKEIKELADLARKGKLQRENLQGASITLTNLGSLGGLYGTPIINPPEVAIIGIYRLFKQLVQKGENQFEEKAFMNISLTCDHRLIDGATSARFLKSFVNKIAEPSLLILD